MIEIYRASRSTWRLTQEMYLTANRERMHTFEWRCECPSEGGALADIRVVTVRNQDDCWQCPVCGMTQLFKATDPISKPGITVAQHDLHLVHNWIRRTVACVAQIDASRVEVYIELELEVG